MNKKLKLFFIACCVMLGFSSAAFADSTTLHYLPEHIYCDKGKCLVLSRYFSMAGGSVPVDEKETTYTFVSLTYNKVPGLEYTAVYDVASNPANHLTMGTPYAGIKPATTAPNNNWTTKNGTPFCSGSAQACPFTNTPFQTKQQ